MRRRTLLAAALSAPVPTRAQDASRPVFLGMAQPALDRAYDQAVWAPNASSVIARYATDSATARAAHRPRTERYGPTEPEQLDIFMPQAGAPPAGRPLLVFLHGGAWLRLSRNEAAAPAPAFLAAGAAYCAPGFANAQAVGVGGMAAQLHGAALWIVRNARALGVDPGRIVLAGHSSGAHLAACLLTTDWLALGLPGNPFAGAVLISGVYDLYPVLLSSRRAYMRLTDADSVALSPIRNLFRLGCPVALARGDSESTEFQRQTDTFAEALAGMGRLQSRRVLSPANHFEAAEALADPASAVHQDARVLLGL